MSKVDWINWKTSPEEIINEDKLIEQIEVLFQDYNSYMNPVVYENIKYEIQYGALDKSSINIMGTSPANEMAVKILDDIDEIKEILEQVKIKIEKDALEQKKIEKQQLIDKLNEKIEIEKEKLEHIKESNNQEDIIYQEEFIKHLNDRLEIAKGI